MSPKSVEVMRTELLEYFHPLFSDTGGIDSWIQSAEASVLERLLAIDDGEHLRLAQLNQLLILSHEAGVSDGFFRYYWCSSPVHPWDIHALDSYNSERSDDDQITSLANLRWGLQRFYVDALLYFGSIRTAYRELRQRSYAELSDYFRARCHDPDYMRERSAPLPLEDIALDDRYLVAELACKTMELEGDQDIVEVLLAGYRERAERGVRPSSLKELFEDGLGRDVDLEAGQLRFSFDDVLDAHIATEDDLVSLAQSHVAKWQDARMRALVNTRRYLSMVGDMDVYVATSMRTREDFRAMARRCDEIFKNVEMSDLNIRYFDPTLSAAEGHEDKGLIECLMVRAAKALIYFAGEKESFGKDAEAAMALSQGKPVFFVCDEEQRRQFYRDVHPLSRLIEYDTGVAVGAIVVTMDELNTLVELLDRTFRNAMQYVLNQERRGYLRLIEPETKSVVRLQTSDQMLRETFWNYYHEIRGPRGLNQDAHNEAHGR